MHGLLSLSAQFEHVSVAAWSLMRQCDTHSSWGPHLNVKPEYEMMPAQVCAQWCNWSILLETRGKPEANRLFGELWLWLYNCQLTKPKLGLCRNAGCNLSACTALVRIPQTVHCCFLEAVLHAILGTTWKSEFASLIIFNLWCLK